MKIEYPAQVQLAHLKRLWAKCFGDPQGFIDGFFETGYSHNRCRCIMDADTVVAALYWLDAEYQSQKLAYLYAVATDPAYRGRGLCRMLMEDTHGLLRAEGYAAAILMPGEPGLREMYRKLGYENCCEITEFSAEAGKPLAVTQISWQEYENLRPSFLPEDGAVQDGLSFLAAYAQFYRGDGFLLAAAKDGDSLLGLELLGKKEAAPGILAALNCKTGIFRSPGRGKQTVMIHPLQHRMEKPGYVGLTFD